MKGERREAERLETWASHTTWIRGTRQGRYDCKPTQVAAEWLPVSRLTDEVMGSSLLIVGVHQPRSSSSAIFTTHHCDISQGLPALPSLLHITVTSAKVFQLCHLYYSSLWHQPRSSSSAIFTNHHCGISQGLPALPFLLIITAAATRQTDKLLLLTKAHYKLLLLTKAHYKLLFHKLLLLTKHITNCYFSLSTLQTVTSHKGTLQTVTSHKGTLQTVISQTVTSH